MYIKDPIKRVQYTFRIKENLMEDLKVYARAKDMKVPRLLNDIIEEYLDGMNMSNTWLNEPLHAIITVPNKIPFKEHINALIIQDGLQYEVKAMPCNLDTWNDKYGYIANSKGLKHKGVELLIIPGLIKDIELHKEEETAQKIAQCLFGLYFTLHDNGQLHVEIISHNNAIAQLQFVNPNLANLYVQTRTALNNIINDHLARLNDTNNNHIKQQLLEELEELALKTNTGNILPIIGQPGNTNILQSDNPYLNGSKHTIAFEKDIIFEDMQNRIDELEKENTKYKESLNNLSKDIKNIEAREKVWEILKKDNKEMGDYLKKMDNIMKRLNEIEAKRPTGNEFIKENKEQ